MSAEPIGQRDSYFQISLVGKMQSSNIDISDPPQLGEDDNIKVLASSALSTEQSAEVKAIQEEQFGFSEVFRQHGQNGILWIDGHSAEFEIFLDEQQRITIVDIHGTKLHPENVTVLKFKDQEISAGEIGEASKDQIEFEWTNFSNLTIKIPKWIDI